MDLRYSSQMNQCYSSVLRLSFIQKIRENTYKRGAKGPGGGGGLPPMRALSLSLLFVSFGSACPYASKMYFPILGGRNPLCPHLPDKNIKQL